MLRIFNNLTFAKKVTRYYKYINIDFRQPIISSDGTLGEDSFALYASSEYSADYAAWKAFDEKSNTEWAARGVPENLSYIIYNPQPLNITKIEVVNRTTSENISTCQIEASNDNENWKTITPVITNSNNSALGEWKIDISENQEYYNYYKILILTGSGNVGFTKLRIVAKQKIAVETSKDDDFDFIESGFVKNSGWAVVERKKKYYKYGDEAEFIQPVLDSNGVLGGSTFAVIASSECVSTVRKAYMSFDGNMSTKWGVNNVAQKTGWLVFYNPNPLKISSIKYSSTTDYPAEDGGDITIYGSKDNDDWKQLYKGDYKGGSGVVKDWDIQSQEYYKYHKIEITNGVHNYIGLGELTISAKEQVPIETDKDDYDYIVNVPVVKLVDR